MNETPPADPSVADLVSVLSELGVIVGAIAAVFVTAGIIVFGAMLLRASRYPWPVPIIAPIAMLTLVFGLVGLVTSSLVPLAGAGIGALAGVLTAQLGKHTPAGDASSEPLPDAAAADTPSSRPVLDDGDDTG